MSDIVQLSYISVPVIAEDGFCGGGPVVESVEVVVEALEGVEAVEAVKRMHHIRTDGPTDRRTHPLSLI